MNLDAYTVRKLAPKLLIAVVAVNISIYLCVAAIDITNIFGRGINQLITAPFMQAAEGKFQLDALQGGDDTLIFFGITAAIGILLILSLAHGQLLPMIALTMFPIVLAVLAVLVTLVIRKALLVLLTIISPVAFALWVLPGTEKYFKQWWSLFLKTLMVYPIVAALFAVTNIMAVVTFDSGTLSQEEVVAAGELDSGQAGGLGDEGFGSNALNAIIGVILVFIPLFMIPFAFKFAGGAIGALSNKLSELQKPFSRMAGRARQKRLESNFQKGLSGALFKTGKKSRRTKHAGYFRSRELGASRKAAALSGLRRATTRPNLADANRGIAKVGAMPAMGFDPRKWRKRLSNKRAQSAFGGVQKAMEDPDFAGFRGEETIDQAIQEGRDDREVKERFRQLSGWTPGETNNRFFDAKGDLTPVGNELYTSATKFREEHGADTAGMAAAVAQASTSPGWGRTREAYMEDDLGEADTATHRFSDALINASGGNAGVAVQLAQLAEKEAPGKIDQTGGSKTDLGAMLYTGSSLGLDSKKYKDTVAAYTLSIASHGGAGAMAQAKPVSFDNGMGLLQRLATNGNKKARGEPIGRESDWPKLNEAEQELSDPIAVARLMQRLSTNNNYAPEVNARELGSALNDKIHDFDTGSGVVVPGQSYAQIQRHLQNGYVEQPGGAGVLGPDGKPLREAQRIPISEDILERFEGGIYTFGRSAIDQEYQMHTHAEQQRAEQERQQQQQGGQQ